MERDKVKKILLDLVYTADSKPRFVGGDLETKLGYIDDGVNKVMELIHVHDRVNRIGNILCESDEMTIHEQVNAIEAQAEIDGRVFIDDVEGVLVWEPLEWTLNCDSFLEQIG